MNQEFKVGFILVHFKIGHGIICDIEELWYGLVGFVEFFKFLCHRLVRFVFKILGVIGCIIIIRINNYIIRIMNGKFTTFSKFHLIECYITSIPIFYKINQINLLKKITKITSNFYYQRYFLL